MLLEYGITNITYVFCASFFFRDRFFGFFGVFGRAVGSVCDGFVPHDVFCAHVASSCHGIVDHVLVVGFYVHALAGEFDANLGVESVSVLINEPKQKEKRHHQPCCYQIEPSGDNYATLCGCYNLGTKKRQRKRKTEKETENTSKRKQQHLQQLQGKQNRK